MSRTLRSALKATLASVVFSAVSPALAAAQADALLSLLGNATDFDFYRSWVSVPRGELKPEQGERIGGVGFELVFDIPGGVWHRKRKLPTKPKKVDGASCESRFRRVEITEDSACADTSYTLAKRVSIRGDTTYEEQAKVEEFDWKPPFIGFELAVGFSQTGALVARESSTQMRASVREAPAVTFYATVAKSAVRMYFGARTGIVTLTGGRAYIGDSATAVEFGGDAFQIGPVFGLALSYKKLHLFAESAYIWRDIESIEWSDSQNVGLAPRSANLEGFSFAVGFQFTFKDKE